MTRTILPKAYLELVEKCGGLLLEGDPPDDVIGVIVPVTLYKPENVSKQIAVEIFFTDAVAAAKLLKSSTALLEQTCEGWRLGGIALRESKRQFYCSFCGKKRRDVGGLHYGLDASICIGCVDEIHSQRGASKRDV